MVLFIDSFIKSIKISIAKYQQYLIPIGMDVSFFILYGAIMGGIFKKAMFYLVQAGYTALSTYQNKPESGLFELMFSIPETRMALLKISFLLLLTIVLIFFAYGFTQGTAWARTKNILSKTGTKKYIHAFFRINLFWFIVFILYKMILLMFRVGSTLANNITQTRSSGELIFLFVFLYFVFLSYALLKDELSAWNNLKTTFKTGIIKAHKFIPIYVLFGFILLGLHYFIIFISPYIPSQVSLVLSMGLLLPALTFGRLYLFHAAQND